MSLTVISAMDLAARTLDLMTVISKSSGTYTQTGLELLQWLGREQISKEALCFVLSKCQDFVQPNKHGQVVLRQLDISASRLYGLRLIIPGALGRSIMLDPKLRWIATTAAVLLQHRDLEITSSLMIDLLVYLNVPRGDAREEIFKERMSPVVQKMISSIALHSVNMGAGFESLPNALLQLPRQRRGCDIADAIIKIQHSSTSSLLYESQYSDLILIAWIYHHWNGKLVVVVDNTIKFQQHVGPERRDLKVLISEPPCGETDCVKDDHTGTVRIASLSPFKSNDGDIVYERDFRPDQRETTKPACRSPLYDFINPFGARFLLLNKTEKKLCEKSAQRITRSIMNLRVHPDGGKYATYLRLRIDPYQTRKSLTPFHSWVQNIPSLLQLNLDADAYERQLYYPSDDTCLEVPRLNSYLEDEEVKNEAFYETKSIIEWYPEISDAMNQARDRCACGCKETLLQLRNGCLQSLMYAEILLLVGHAMTEAAGAVDISNLASSRSTRGLIFATAYLLGDIAHTGTISWSSWFRVAATAITGVPYKYGSTRGPEVLCVVAGSMTVMPTWLIFDEEITTAHSWAVKTLVGVPIGVTSEQTILLERPTNKATLQDLPQAELQFMSSDLANEEISVETAAIGIDNEMCHLMTLVSTSKSVRCISPVSVYLGAIHAIRPTCSHEPTSRDVHAWDMSSVLQSWHNNMDLVSARYSVHAHVAFVGNVIAKRNFAVGLAGFGCVLQTGSCCLGCLTDTALKEKQFAVAFDENISESRFLLN